jgi:hypothetical protein
MKTILFKDPRNGWQAKTEIEIKPNFVLDFSTHRNCNGCLISRASIWRLTGDGGKTHCYGLGGHGDFGCPVATTQPARVTSKVVTEQHDRALLEFERIKLLAIDHYAIYKLQATVPDPQPLGMEG